jgi:hypothetical protein
MISSQKAVESLLPRPVQTRFAECLGGKIFTVCSALTVIVLCTGTGLAWHMGETARTRLLEVKKCRRAVMAVSRIQKILSKAEGEQVCIGCCVSSDRFPRLIEMNRASGSGHFC